MRKLFLYVLALFGFSACTAMGGNLSDKKKEAFKKSPQYDVQKEVFTNRQEGLIDKMMKRNMSFSNILKFFKGHGGLAPEKKLPEIKPELKNFLQADQEVKVIWFGHSTLLVNLSGKIILIDPVFSGAASPVSFMVKRYQDPILKLKELPEVDYIVISHDHYDHLDMESIKFFKDKKTQFITPLGVGSHLEKWGIPSQRITEKDWWEKVSFDNITFIATPAQHFSGRGLFDRKKTLWASWVIQSPDHNIYFSGDSGYDTHFKDIGDKYGPFDVAFLESGQYNELWPEVHMFPEDALKAYNDLKAKSFFPIHWGMFTLAYHKWNEPIERLFKNNKDSKVKLIVPKLGEIISIRNDFLNDMWWTQALNK